MPIQHLGSTSAPRPQATAALPSASTIALHLGSRASSSPVRSVPRFRGGKRISGGLQHPRGLFHTERSLLTEYRSLIGRVYSIASHLPGPKAGGVGAGLHHTPFGWNIQVLVNPSDERSRPSGGPQVGLSLIYSTVKPKLVKSKGNDTTFIKVPIQRRTTSANDNPYTASYGKLGDYINSLDRDLGV